MKIKVNPHSSTPIYEQMVAAIIAAIEANQLGTGDRLPSIRGLSAQLGINPNTTVRVYRELELRGFIESKTGSGCYVLPKNEETAARDKATRMQQLYSDMLEEARERRIEERDFIRFLKDEDQHMNRFRTSWTVFKHSFGVVRQNGKLLVFPLFSIVAGFGLFAFYFVPLVFHVTTTDVWHGITNPVAALEAMTASMQASTLRLRANGLRELVPHFSFAGMAGFYLLSLFTAAFLNVAFYSQIIQALNGGRVSISRGFALALARLPAITGWVLFSGTVGVILRAIQNRIGVIGQLVIASLGVSWSIASVFVIPVIINEPGMGNPIRYLKISGGLIKRTWGEGLIGFVSILVIGIPASYAVMFIGGFLAKITGLTSIVLVGALLGVGMFYLQIVISKVFRCGLYIYATEGVAPGTFNVEDFQRAWIVRRRS